MKRAFAISALFCGGYAAEDAVPPVCRLGDDFAEDGTPCRADGDVLIQKNILRKNTPGGDPPAEASEHMELRS
jgi:hypothetical protein